MRLSTTIFVVLCAMTTAVSVQAAALGADRHAQAGVKCESCHGNDKANPVAPEIDVCTGCHNPDQLVEKTKDHKPTNPHVSPHYGKALECTYCHVQHGQTEDFCSQCHNFGFKVP